MGILQWCRCISTTAVLAVVAKALLPSAAWTSRTWHETRFKRLRISNLGGNSASNRAIHCRCERIGCPRALKEKSQEER
ncbi:hypothetical protein Enr8_20640 [Blastopirellula retiformator]|uniref:Secreted protein n=1 Tax=Blastopirellula retiformator TaxID=2527970 RepID=A0A5C5V8P2_9BACT|nr:hypothetical protein Enr8_20640 [Blastopirellula retiformator]